MTFFDKRQWCRDVSLTQIFLQTELSNRISGKKNKIRPNPNYFSCFLGVPAIVQAGLCLDRPEEETDELVS